MRIRRSASGTWLRASNCRNSGEQESRITAIALSPDGQILASANLANVIRLWDLASGQELRQFPGNNIHTLTFLPDGKTLVGAATDRTIRCWEVATGKEQDRPVERSAVIAPEGIPITWQPRDGRMHIADRATGKDLLVVPLRKSEQLSSFVLSPDGKYLG